MLAIRCILHPTDFSDRSEPAFELACALARDYKADLVVFHAVDPDFEFAPEGGMIIDRMEKLSNARRQLDRMRSDDPKLRIRLRLVEGYAAWTILEAAREEQADLIVLGTHGRSGVSRVLMGSVAEDILRNALCPVLTVKAKTSPKPGISSSPTVHSKTAESELVATNQ